MQIKSVVIIGSGTMGSGIAAHLCNANVPVTLLDLSTDISTKARERIYKSRPPLLIDKNKINNTRSVAEILKKLVCFSRSFKLFDEGNQAIPAPIKNSQNLVGNM